MMTPNITDRTLGKCCVGWSSAVFTLFLASKCWDLVPLMVWHIADLITVALCFIIGIRLWKGNRSSADA